MYGESSAPGSEYPGAHSARTPSLGLVTQDGQRLSDDTARNTAGDPLPLEIRGLTVSYGERAAVFDANLTFQAGRMTAIVGPNGAGKSTLLKAALGIVPQVSGDVRFFGSKLGKVRDRIAYVPQRASVDWDFPTTVGDVVAMGLTRRLGLFGRITASEAACITSALDRVGMSAFADRQIGQLSGGQQQRVFLARALAQDADLYLLDEPFAGVDAATEAAIFAVLQDLRVSGRTVVCVHHDLSTVRDTFDDVVLLNVHVVRSGTVEDAFTADALREAYGPRLTDAMPLGLDGKGLDQTPLEASGAPRAVHGRPGHAS